jgi:4-hydroxybenzoate polyprenyltransferase
MTTVKNYLSLIKFSHTIFAMPFALIGFFLGIYSFSFSEGLLQSGIFGDPTTFLFFKGEPGDNYDDIYIAYIKLFVLVVLCMVFARSAAMAFNRYLDRHFDAKNPRTAIREIPSGILKANSVLWFTIICSALFMVCTWFLNPICFYLSPVALFVILFYSYTKRFTPLCHLVLGLGLSLAPIGAFLAVTGHFEILPILFSLAVIFWVSGFDIIYSLQDEEFDKSQKLKSFPAWLGKKKALRVSRVLHGLSVACVITAGWVSLFHWLYWTGVAIFVGMILYQHSIVKHDDLRRVNIAFMTANGIASVLFAVFVIADLVLYGYPINLYPTIN